ncbi:hypothetical protein [Microbacterium allomyrinae]|uniref:Uncharacterized protein n=1 Tax=Microbacterium allomyrinae TaxID=2830666 RepID=A0A9X1LWH8_9MICO|nr:hypothetical protein [Microbacterium allomyrinae]MCC2033106.1 hypothetical protein [Microbacterium allomyrinae]
MTEQRRLQTSLPAESIAKATGLTTERVRAALDGDSSARVSDLVMVGGLLGVTPKELMP